MGYYKGDFYGYGRSNYYMGDPGFWSTIGGIFKGVGSAAASFIPGVGPLISKGISSIGAKAPSAAGMALTPPGFYSGATRVVGAAAGSMVRKGVAIAKAHPVLTAAGAAGVLAAGSGAVGAKIGAARARAAMGGRRNRRMRVTIPKSLLRAIRRAEGFKRLALKVLSFTGPRRHRGHAYFKRPRRSKRV